MPSKSQAQQKFMGMVHALQKGDMKPSDASSSVKKAAQSMSNKDAKDYASTKHKGLPKRVRQEILNKLKEYSNKMGRDHLGGDDYTSSKKGGLRDFDGYDNVDYNKDMPMDEGMFSAIDHIRQNSKNVRDFIKNVLSDKQFRDMKSDKDFIKYLGSIYEGTIQESHYTAIANLGTKKAKENLDSFDELQKFMDKMKSRKAISVQVTKINGSKKQTIDYDWDGRNWVSKNKKGVQENFPSNWLQGRTSDYHTKLRGKKREYDDTNFEKDNSGQPDLEEVTKPDYNSKGFKEANKLVAKLRSSIFKKMNDNDLDQFRMVLAQAFDLKESVNESGYSLEDLIGQVKTFNKPKTQKLLTIYVINKLKEKRNNSKSKSNQIKIQKLIDKIEGEYKKGKYLKEFGSRLTEPFLLPKDEDKLDGTPPSKDAIDRVSENENSGEIDMVLGVLSILRQVEDKENRKRMAINIIKKFKEDDVDFDYKEFLNLMKENLDNSKRIDEIMITLTQNIAQEIIPMNTWSRYASDGKKNAEFVKNLMRDLTQTLNKFYKSHDINVRVKEK